MFDFPSSPGIGQSYSPSSGVTYQWDGQAWVSTGLLATASIIDRIYLTGVSTWNKPAGLAYAEVDGTAAGGSGSGAAATAASTFSGGGGGSAGAWGKKLFAASDLPASVTITVGAPGAASSGAGNAAANTTFGSLITLPGGPGGLQSANTTGSNVLGSQSAESGPPVGVDIGAAGQRGYQSILNIFAGLNSMIGGGGPSPYGSAFPTWTTTNTPGIPGSGYGAGGNAAANGASQSVRVSAAGQPGFIRVREFYTASASGVGGDAPSDGNEYVRVNGVWRLKEQNFAVGSTGVVVPVPPTAKMAVVKGRLYAATGAPATLLQMSNDGTNFLTTSGDYINGGSVLYAGSAVSPAKAAPANATAIVVALAPDGFNLAVLFDVDLVVNKLAPSGLFTARARGTAHHSAATALVQDNFYYGWSNVAALNNLTQLPAFRLFASGGTYAAHSSITVEWVY